MANISLDTVLSGFKAVAKYVSNFTILENSINDDMVHRDGTNSMSGDLDLNNNDINNAGNINTTTIAVGGVDLTEQVSAAADSAAAALVSENNAASSESNASTSEGNALTSENNAQAWATEDEDVVVSGGEFSAKHYAAKAATLASGSLVSSVHSGDNSTVTFALGFTPDSEVNTFVFISGVYQQKSEYSLSGSNITFTVAPPTGTNNIEVVANVPVTGTGLVSGNNLSDVGSAATSRSNLAVAGTGDANTFTALQDMTTGAKFGNSAVANGDVLDWYEEGQWTPVVADATTGGNTGTYSGGATFNRYTRIGNLVKATAYLQNIDTTGMTAGNTFYVRGLPFTSSATNLTWGSLEARSVTLTGQQTCWHLANSGTWVQFRDTVSGANQTTLVVSKLTSGSADLQFTVIYEV